MAEHQTLTEFDETGYLARYPDVAAAVAKGDLQSGYDHYVKYGRNEGRLPQGGSPPRTDANLTLFETRAPSPQTAVDVFSGHWACDLGTLLGVTGSGKSDLFTADRRPQLMADTLGENGRLDGMSILEIGPLEGAHSYAMEKLGAASILAVESNREAWLKCLIVKELLGLSRTKFALGDINEYFGHRTQTFDAIMCSGVLYHMSDPVGFIRRVAAASDRCFVWTHYLDEAINAKGFTRSLVSDGDLQVEYWSHEYGTLSNQFWGGIAPTSCWLTRAHMLATFAHFGLTDINVIHDDPAHPNGPSILFSARRR